MNHEKKFYCHFCININIIIVLLINSLFSDAARCSICHERIIPIGKLKNFILNQIK